MHGLAEASKRAGAMLDERGPTSLFDMITGNNMTWSSLTFGKYSGRTLPEVLLIDADWFFWATSRGVFKGRLAVEARELGRKARAIKIPKRRPSRWAVEYSYEDNGRFS